MSYNNGIITIDSSIGVGDIQSALHTGKTDTFELCTHPSINIWSKYKPVRSPYLDFSGALFSEWDNDTSEFHSATRAKYPHYRRDWYKGDDYDCGIELHSYNSVPALIDDFSNNWKYKRLRLNLDYARKTDFNGYNSKAVNPFVISSNGGMLMYDINGNVNYLEYPSVRCYLNANGINYDYNLSIEDIIYRPKEGAALGQIELKQMYFGVVWRALGVYWLVTANTNFTATGTGSFMKEINDFRSATGNSALDNGENILYPVLSLERHTVPVLNPSETIIPLPLPTLKIKMMALSQVINAHAYFVDDAGNRITSITLQRNMNSSATLKFKFELENKSGFNLAWSGYGRVYYYYNTIGVSGTPVKYVLGDNNFVGTYQTTMNGDTGTSTATQTYWDLYDTNWLVNGGSGYPASIYVDYSITLPTGYENIGATARLDIQWQ